jgi:hypothetical protein
MTTKEEESTWKKTMANICLGKYVQEPQPGQDLQSQSRPHNGVLCSEQEIDLAL